MLNGCTVCFDFEKFNSTLASGRISHSNLQSKSEYSITHRRLEIHQWEKIQRNFYGRYSTRMQRTSYPEYSQNKLVQDYIRLHSNIILFIYIIFIELYTSLFTPNSVPSVLVSPRWGLVPTSEGERPSQTQAGTHTHTHTTHTHTHSETEHTHTIFPSWVGNFPRLLEL
jgi:hypothetical protein